MSSHQTLQEARSGWKSTIHGDGGICPCCDRWGKVYSRAINSTMALSLQWLYDANMKAGVRCWVDVPNSAPKEVLRSNQLATLRWWGLVERELPDPEDKKRKFSGNWRITLRGMDFVEGRALVPKKVMTYNGDVVGSSDEMTTFEACKGAGFNYSSVMTTTFVAGTDRLFPKGNML